MLDLASIEPTEEMTFTEQPKVLPEIHQGMELIVQLDLHPSLNPSLFILDHGNH